MRTEFDRPLVRSSDIFALAATPIFTVVRAHRLSGFNPSWTPRKDIQGLVSSSEHDGKSSAGEGESARQARTTGRFLKSHAFLNLMIYDRVRTSNHPYGPRRRL